MLCAQTEHPTDRIVAAEMAPWQGAALMIANDGDIFTEANVTALANTASGSKKGRKDCTGRYGLGFCSVYNVTDVPAILSGARLIIFDPHETHLQQQGGEEWDIGDVAELFPDSAAAFACCGAAVGTAFAAPYQGTLLRLPLRNATTAPRSQISPRPFDGPRVREIVAALVEGGVGLLLFARSVERVQLLEREVAGRGAASAFSACLVGVSAKERELRAERSDATSPAVLRFQIEVSSNSSGPATAGAGAKSKEDWLVCMCEDRAVAEDTLLDGRPLSGGVALRLPPQGLRESEQGEWPLAAAGAARVFCTFELPEPRSGLPLHVNGSFAVDSGRRGLQKGDPATSDGRAIDAWNEMVAVCAIAPAYASTVLRVAQLPNATAADVYALWPGEHANPERPWPQLAETFARLAAAMPLFRTCAGTWVTVVDKGTLVLPQALETAHPGFTAVLASGPEATRVAVLPAHVLSLLGRAKVPLQILTVESVYRECVFPRLSALPEPLRCAMLAPLLDALVTDTAADAPLRAIAKDLRSVPCVPCVSASGAAGRGLALPSALVDPSEPDMAALFAQTDPVLPAAPFNSPARVLALEALGLRRTVTADLAAQQIHAVAAAQNAQWARRVLQVVLRRKLAVAAACADAPWLPVMAPPDPWPAELPWGGSAPSDAKTKAGDTTAKVRCVQQASRACATANGGLRALQAVLKSPGELYPPSQFPLCCLLRPLLTLPPDTAATDASIIPLLWRSPPTLPDALLLEQLTLLSKLRDTAAHAGLIDTLSVALHAHLSPAAAGKLGDAPWVWLRSVRAFLRPSQLAVDASSRAYGSVLVGVPSSDPLCKLLDLQPFSIAQVAAALTALAEKGPAPLQSADVDVAAALLNDHALALGSVAKRTVFVLAEEKGAAVMRPAASLRFPDGRLRDDATVASLLGASVLYTHPRVALATARALGIQCMWDVYLGRGGGGSDVLGSMVLEQQSVPTAQRIRDIVRDYPDEGSNVLRELLQNAEDAGATRVHFTLDQQTWQVGAGERLPARLPLLAAHALHTRGSGARVLLAGLVCDGSAAWRATLSDLFLRVLLFEACVAVAAFSTATGSTLLMLRVLHRHVPRPW
jgi:hypothetical protein